MGGGIMSRGGRGRKGVSGGGWRRGGAGKREPEGGNPLWLGGTLAVGAIAAIKLLWFGSLNFQFGGNATTDAIVEILIALVFVWGTIWFAILSLRVGKYISVFGSYLKLGLLGVFVIL